MSKQTGTAKQGAFSALNREQLYRSLGEETFDLLVIGGGITGAGIALDAQTRGLKTALVDMQDFAAGTSSRSTKLVHGGLRYLKQLEIGVVAEVGKERAIVYENGPHVTTPEWMLLPFIQAELSANSRPHSASAYMIFWQASNAASAGKCSA